jgi:hypothetical protein
MDNPAKETANKLADALNAASPEKPYGWIASAWQPAGKNWARVYAKANSRSARALGHFFVKPDGTVASYTGKQQLALNRAAVAAGMGAADFAEDSN